MRNLLTVFFALCTLNTITVSARPAFDYSALRDGTFEQKTVSGVRSLSDGERYTTMSDGRVLCFSYRTGEPAGVLFDASAAEPRIEFTDYVLSADERRLLLTTDVEPIYRHSFTAEYWIYDRQDGSAAATFAGRAAAAGAVFARRQPGGFRARRQPVRLPIRRPDRSGS